jgi:signal transduction histidine kinase
MNQIARQIVLVSADAALCRALEADLKSAGDTFAVIALADPEEVRRCARQSRALGTPAVILLDESALPPPNGPGERTEQLEAAAAALAGIAPVVVLAGPEHQAELATLVAEGAAEFVARAGDFPAVVVALIERRLRASEAGQHLTGSMFEGEDFGETLRHELNNPLTGILGNAELLLAEIRRRADDRLPESALQRLETITGLAMRMRETIRRLSAQWESQHDPVRWL